METLQLSSDILERVFNEQREQGIELGRAATGQQAILQVLRVRFAAVPEPVAARVAQITSQERLIMLLETAVTAPSLAEFERALD